MTTKYDVWFRIHDEYCVTVEAESMDHAVDMVYDNPQSDFLDRSWVNGDIDVTHIQEAKDD